jgi:hypothetical protein
MALYSSSNTEDKIAISDADNWYLSGAVLAK